MIRFRMLALVVMSALLAASCSSVEEAGRASPTSAPPGTSEPPSSLAFADEDGDGRAILRVSVPKIIFVAPHFVDPTDPVQILVTDLLTDGLTELDPTTGRARPALAEDWSVSADRLTWMFTLRSATFSTGEPIRAIDAATSLNRLAARGVDSLSGIKLSVVEGYAAVAGGEAATMTGVKVLDDSTLIIELNQPFEPLPELLAGVSFGVFPVDIDTRGALPLSSSMDFQPTVLSEEGFDPQSGRSRFRMSAKADDGELAGIELRIDPTGDLIESGQVDVAIGLEPEDDFTADLVEVTVPRAASAYFAFNVKAAPFDDPLIRKAILQAIDRVELRDAHFPDADVMDGVVVDSIAGSVENACADWCSPNSRAAARKIRRSDSSDIPFTVDYFVAEDDTSEQRLAQDLVASLRDAGLNATARGQSVDDYGNLIASGEMPMFRFGSVSPALMADAFLQPFTSESRDNVTGLSMPDFDELVLDARATIDDDERDARYAEAEALLFENAVLLPLVQFTQRIVHTKAIDTLRVEADGSLDLDSLVFAG